MLVARVGEEILDPNSQPRFYQAYNLLSMGDMIISIEHCHNCEHHCATLRHDASEYVRKADYMLRTLAQIAHGMCLSLSFSFHFYLSLIVCFYLLSLIHSLTTSYISPICPPSHGYVCSC